MVVTMRCSMREMNLHGMITCYSLERPMDYQRKLVSGWLIYGWVIVWGCGFGLLRMQMRMCLIYYFKFALCVCSLSKP